MNKYYILYIRGEGNICIHTYSFIHIYTCIYVCTYTHIHIHICVFIHVYVHTYV